MAGRCLGKRRTPCEGVQLRAQRTRFYVGHPTDLAFSDFQSSFEGSSELFCPARVASRMEALWQTIDTLLGVSATKAEELTIGQVCLRAVVVYIVLIAYVRFAKKRFIGQATAFDFILVIIVGSISSRAISGTAPFFASLAGTFVLILMSSHISAEVRKY